MKNYLLGTAIISLGLLSCKKSEVNVETVENPDGTVTTTTVEKEHSTTLDSVKINATLDNAKEPLDEAGQTFKQAGEDIKDAAAKGAEKVEKGAEKVKEDLKKK